MLLTRLSAIGAKKPDFVTIGIGGFEGYTVFGFVQRRLCVLESPQVNNATHVLPMDSWETVARMTKAEILDAESHTARIVHTRAWFDALDEVLHDGRKATQYASCNVPFIRVDQSGIWACLKCSFELSHFFEYDSIVSAGFNAVTTHKHSINYLPQNQPPHNNA